ncbi:MAG: hypothetical protein DI534_11425 [Leifsonia xyli]|nr:MAG: hypothetical protein DI534_11425 [Leifsonia xyli]
MKEALSEQLSKWAEQRAQRLQLGDDLEQAREVDHAVVFRTKSHAAAAARSFEAAGFAVVVHSRLWKTTVEASRSETLTEENVARFLGEALGIAEANGGAYDGFGGMIVPRVHEG